MVHAILHVLLKSWAAQKNKKKSKYRSSKGQSDEKKYSTYDYPNSLSKLYAALNLSSKKSSSSASGPESPFLILEP